ncbi:transmembrane protein, putative (macronuclear) [Tetrahymena thermophila SB210]|uniref:Transmembrane protein, putative n=1 Tax=Tetrahymena thermophila (strain SB210) TaxID=312017 RepID=W7X3H3_TETTS|nr:transmembrane protein, putative [Tetrahymena thermophila SB210]EWS73845.1 transmembrane protein, putative [Tetrahymena thermophila SB210]|eukprot:XP_012653592.1 transmembrane protein, putative [Tetrahymena thermophila SB210]
MFIQIWRKYFLSFYIFTKILQACLIWFILQIIQEYDILLLVVFIGCILFERIATFNIKANSISLSKLQYMFYFLFSLLHIDDIFMLIFYKKFQNYFRTGLGTSCYVSNLIYIAISSSFIQWLSEKEVFQQPQVLIGLIPILSIIIVVHIIKYLVFFNNDSNQIEQLNTTSKLVLNLLIQWILTTSYLMGLIICQSIPFFTYYWFSSLGLFFLIFLIKFKNEIIFSEKALFMKVSEVFIICIQIIYHVPIDLRVSYNKCNFDYIRRFGCSFMNWLLTFFFSQMLFIFLSYLLTIKFYEDSIQNPYKIIYLVFIAISLVVHLKRLITIVIQPMIYGPRVIQIKQIDQLIKYNNNQIQEKFQQLEIVFINLTEFGENIEQQLLFSSLFKFGKSEIRINTSHYTRLNIQTQEKYKYQQITLQSNLQENMLIKELQNNNILPQIWEISYINNSQNQILHYLSILKIFINNNQYVKISTQKIELDLYQKILDIHQAFIIKIRVIIYLQRIAFSKSFEKQLIFNPHQIFYDLYDI